MDEEIDEIELLPFRVLSETGSAKFVARERFVHTRAEPRFFVLQLSPRNKEYGNGYRFVVQLLDDVGRAGAVLSFCELNQDFRQQEYYVPASVIAAALRQPEGKGDYVDEAGHSCRPF
jgi:hypothetical protein